MPAGLRHMELGLPPWRKARPACVLEQAAALFCCKGESVVERNTGDEVKLHTEEVHSLYPPLDFVRAIKARVMGTCRRTKIISQIILK